MENTLAREALWPANDQKEARSKKNSEPLITPAFTAENQSGFIMIRTSDPQICEVLSCGRPIAESDRSVRSLNHWAIVPNDRD